MVEDRELNQLVKKAIEHSTPRRLYEDPRVEVLNSYPFNTIVTAEESSEAVEHSFPCEIIRIHLSPSESRVYRLIKPPVTTQTTGPVLVFDNRGNSERELTSDFFPKQQLSEAYRRLLNGEISGVLTAIREGALGPTPTEISPASTLPTYTTDLLRYGNPWDINEEVKSAEAMYFLLSMQDLTHLLEYLGQIVENNQPFINVIARYLESEITLLFENLDSDRLNTLGANVSEEELRFFSEKKEYFTVDLGKGAQQLEKMISYPYPTAQGTIFISLFRLWDTKNSRFKVIRMIQTQPNLDNIEGIRFDSNCTDGVHSLDCHCDCCEQLWMAITLGLEEKKNVVVLEEEDHEGKGYGVVHKGATHLIMREYNEGRKESEMIGNARAAAAYYATHEVPHDIRTYSGSLAVIQALNIQQVNRVLMGNGDKIDALQRGGVKYNTIHPVHAHELSASARLTLKEKGSGIVVGANGRVEYNREEHNPHLRNPHE